MGETGAEPGGAAKLFRISKRNIESFCDSRFVRFRFRALPADDPPIARLGKMPRTELGDELLGKAPPVIHLFYAKNMPRKAPFRVRHPSRGQNASVVSVTWITI
jgi:hypothetical protein